MLVHVLDTRDPGVRPRPGLRPRHHRGGAAAVRRPGGPAPASSSSTRSTSRTARTSPRWSGPTWRRAATASSRCPPSPTWACKELSFALAEIVAEARAAKPEGGGDPDRHPAQGRRRRGLHRHQEEDGLFRVRGEKPERWVRQTDFNNDEAVGYLADRLNRLGVEDELMKAGARAGDGVAIGPEDNAVVFDWEPTITAGAEMLGRRGEDHRLEAPRPAAQRRRDRQAERDEAAEGVPRVDPVSSPAAVRHDVRKTAPGQGFDIVSRCSGAGRPGRPRVPPGTPPVAVHGSVCGARRARLARRLPGVRQSPVLLLPQGRSRVPAHCPRPYHRSRPGRRHRARGWGCRSPSNCSRSPASRSSSTRWRCSRAPTRSTRSSC